MAGLTEAVHESKGRTVLYTPDEDLDDFASAATNKVRDYLVSFVCFLSMFLCVNDYCGYLCMRI